MSVSTESSGFEQHQLQNAVLNAVRASHKSKVLLALSGGLDSMVLLHVLASLREQAGFQLKVAHVHHGLQAQADEWALFCQRQAEALEVDFQLCRVQLADPQRNIEQQARTLRYQALEALLTPDTLLMTAHHADDQLETVLLALKRGSGLPGLAAIAAQKVIAGTLLMRPLLAFSRTDLEQYAAAHQLAFVTDPSNLDDSFDRNFLRRHILPLLQQRFPTISQTTARSCQLLQHSLEYQQQQLRTELPQLLRQNQLDLLRLAQREEPARELLLRAYLQPFGLIPSAEQTREFMQCFMCAAPDAQPMLHWGHWQLRRFDGLLYLLDRQAQQQVMASPEKDTELVADTQQHWQHRQWLWSADATAPGSEWNRLPLAVAVQERLRLCTGQLNQRFKPAGSLHSKALKDWCKQWKVPPWRRGSMPFIIAGQQNLVIAVPGFASHCTADQAQSWLHFKESPNV